MDQHNNAVLTIRVQLSMNLMPTIMYVSVCMFTLLCVCVCMCVCVCVCVCVKRVWPSGEGGGLVDRWREEDKRCTM